MKAVKKSMRSMKALLPVDVSMIRKNKNVVMCALVVMILLAKRLRPLVSNMMGKLAVILFVCYLAMADLSLGLLGVIFFAALNNNFIEGFKEGSDDKEDDEKNNTEEEEFTGREGDAHEDKKEKFRGTREGNEDEEEEEQ